MDRVVIAVKDVIWLSNIKTVVENLEDIEIISILKTSIKEAKMAEFFHFLEREKINLMVLEEGVIPDDFVEAIKIKFIFIGKKEIQNSNGKIIHCEKHSTPRMIMEKASILKLKIKENLIGWSPDEMLEKIKKNENYKKTYEDEIQREENRTKLQTAIMMPQRAIKKQTGIKIIVIGSSIGGLEVIEKILKGIKKDKKIPPILITQHMSKGYIGRVCERMNDEINGLKIKVVENGEELKENCVYFARDGHHMGIERVGVGYKAKLKETVEAIDNHLPSIQAMYVSVNGNIDGKNIMPIILTGMGRDGVLGMGELFARGSNTTAQSRNSCVVFGIAGECVKNGFIVDELEIMEIIKKIDGIN